MFAMFRLLLLQLALLAALGVAKPCMGAPVQTPLTINYESGTTDSGIASLTVTHATAPDAAYLVTPGRSGQYAIAHKVALGDPTYVSDGYPRSESSTEQLFDTAGVYYDNTQATYSFSLLLNNWQSSSSPDEDIIWQFKHDGTAAVDGRHDIALGVSGNSLMLHWNGNISREPIISNVLPYSNEWIDFRFNVDWASDDTGSFTMSMRLQGETAFGHTVSESGFPTFDGTPGAGTFGYLKWGVYEHDGNIANGDPATRIVYDDDISATVTPEPSGGLCILIFAAALRRRRRNLL
jgi:hypothetical protein